MRTLIDKTCNYIPEPPSVRFVVSDAHRPINIGRASLPLGSSKDNFLCIITMCAWSGDRCSTSYNNINDLDILPYCYDIAATLLQCWCYCNVLPPRALPSSARLQVACVAVVKVLLGCCSDINYLHSPPEALHNSSRICRKTLHNSNVVPYSYVCIRSHK